MCSNQFSDKGRCFVRPSDTVFNSCFGWMPFSFHLVNGRFLRLNSRQASLQTFVLLGQDQISPPDDGMSSHLSKSALTSNSFWRSVGFSVWLVSWLWVFVKCWWESLSWISLALQKSLCRCIRYVWAKCTTGVAKPVYLHGEVSYPLKIMLATRRLVLGLERWCNG